MQMPLRCLHAIKSFICVEAHLVGTWPKWSAYKCLTLLTNIRIEANRLSFSRLLNSFKGNNTKWKHRRATILITDTQFWPDIHEYAFVWFFTFLSTMFQLYREGSSWVEPVLSKDKCVSPTVMPVRLEPLAPRSRVKHSTTETLCSNMYMPNIKY